MKYTLDYFAWSRWAPCVIALWLFVGCSSEPAVDPCEDQYPDLQDATWAWSVGQVRYVSTTCGKAGRSGTSRAKPAATFNDALASAAAGDVIVVAPGTYAGGFEVPMGVSIVGYSKDTVSIAGGSGVAISGTGQSLLAQVTITGATGVGLTIDGGHVVLQDAMIKDTKASDDASGDGVWIRGGKFCLDGSRVSFNEGAGVVAMGNDSRIAILDPIWKESAEAAAILDPIWVPDLMASMKQSENKSVIEANSGAGVAILDPIWILDPVWILDPLWQPDGTGAAALIGSAKLDNNDIGIAAFGGRVDTHNMVISQGGGTAIYAEGQKDKGPTITLNKDTKITGGAAALGVWLVSTATLSSTAVFSGQGEAAIWAQGQGVSVDLAAGASFADISGIGIALRSGADLRADAVMFSDIGVDGLQIIGGSSANVTNSNFKKVSRTGVLIDAPGVDDDGMWKIKMKDNTFSDCTAGCTVNGKTHADYKSSNEGNRSNNDYGASVGTAVKDSGSLKWDDKACDGQCSSPKSPSVSK
ncbi:MAG TPA: hypothetical protein DCQ06_06450 [Myxococcales bacterium]|nr:hypothetical protein [Myxococcales bacterium]